MNKILVIGSSNIDYVVTVDVLPVAGETLLGNDLSLYPGGKGANQAVACGLLGGDVTFITALGNTQDNHLLEEMFDKARLNVDGVKHIADTVTGAAYITVDASGQNSIVVISGANKFCTKEYVMQQRKYIEESDIILMQLEIPYDAIRWVAGYAKELGKTVILNPAPFKEGMVLDFLDKIDYLTPNETELHSLTGMPVDSLEEIEKAAKSLLEQGIKCVIVTIGKRGAFYVSGEGCSHHTPPEIRVVDTTAAGDTFNGAIAVGLSEGKSIGEVIDFANHAATLTVSRRGAQSSIPKREEVEKFMKEQKG